MKTLLHTSVLVLLVGGAMSLGTSGVGPSPALAQASAAEPATDGKALFEKAAKALEGIQAVTFSAKLTPEGTTLTKAYVAAAGDVKALRDATSTNGWLIRVTGQGGEQRFDVAWQAGSIEGVDHAKQTVVEKAGAQSPVPGLRNAQAMRLREVLSNQPYREQIGATQFTIEEERTLDGEVCDVVLVDRPGSNQKYRWAIARKDSFPRLIEQIFEGSMQGKLVTEITKVQIDMNTPPALAASAIRVAVPEGYREDRQTATPTVRPVPGKNTPGVEAPVPDAAPVSEPPKAPEAAPAPKGPAAAAGFELLTPNGQKVSLESLKEKVVVLQFWGSWCLACRDWHAQLAETVQRAAGDKMSDVALLALATRERDSQNAVSELAARSDRFTLLLNADEVAKAYDVKVFPATFVIHKGGIIAASTVETDTAARDVVTQAVKLALGQTDASEQQRASN